MAAKKNLEVVPQLPTQPDPDLEDLLASRLADDLIAEVDMGKLTKLAASYIGKRIKARFVNFLKADTSAYIPTSEVEAIEAASEEVAA